MHVVVCTAKKKERLYKTQQTVVRTSGDYDEIHNPYDSIVPYAELPNEDDQVKAAPATNYNHLEHISRTPRNPYDKLTGQRVEIEPANSVRYSTENDSVLIAPYAEFSATDKMKAQPLNAEEVEVCYPKLTDTKSISDNLYAKVNKKNRQGLEGGEISNQSDSSSAAYTQITSANDAVKQFTGLGPTLVDDKRSAVHEYLALKNDVNSAITAPDANNDPGAPQVKSYESLVPDEIPNSINTESASSAYVPLTQNTKKEYVGLDPSRMDAESCTTRDYTQLEVDYQNARKMSETGERKPDMRSTKGSYEPLNQREFVKSDNPAYVPLTQSVEKDYAGLDPSRRADESNKSRDYTSLNTVCQNLA